MFEFGNNLFIQAYFEWSVIVLSSAKVEDALGLKSYFKDLEDFVHKVHTYYYAALINDNIILSYSLSHR